MSEPLNFADEIVLHRLTHDFVFFCRHALKIRPKQEILVGGVQAPLVPFELNPPQQYVLRVMFSMIAQGIPVRIVILKARQFGISTLFLAWIFWHMWRRRQVRCIAAAAVKGTTISSVFAETMKRFFDNMPPEIKPRARAKSRDASLSKEEAYIEPQGSQCVYIEAQDENARSDSLDHVLCTEVGDYEDGKGFFGALDPALGRRTDTTLILESTAKPGYFRSRYLAAKTNKTERAIFLPWTVHRELYHLPLARDTRGRGKECWRDARTEDLVEFSDAELAEQQYLTRQHLRMGLPPVDLEQMYWRQVEINEKYHGDVEWFNQEYPRDDVTCFEKGSGSAFTIVLPTVRESVDETPEVCENIGIGTLELAYGIKLDSSEVEEFKPYIDFVPEPEEGVIDFERTPGLVIFKEPRPNFVYTIGADVADDMQVAADPDDANFSAACVYCCNTREQVAEWRGSIDPEEYGDELAKLGYFYNTALINVELNNMGIATYFQLKRRVNYPERFKWMNVNESDLVDPKKEMWVTSRTTKPLLITSFRTAVRNKHFIVRSPALQEEMIGYRIENGQYKRGPDTQADRIIAAALAWQAVEQTGFGAAQVLGGAEDLKSRSAHGAAKRAVAASKPGRIIMPKPELPAELADLGSQRVIDEWEAAYL